MARSGSSESDIGTSHDLSPELVVIVKKLSKRDSITKVRALEEFEAYLRANEGYVLGILDTWDRLFGKLALDVDRRVRLATQSAHQWIVTVAKRKIAPYLKSMVGPWLACFFDPSKDVARTATSTFSSAFPPEKRKEVLVFCQKSIIDYAGEMILDKTPETLSDPRDVTKEEMDAKFARVIIESFHILAYLFSEIDVADRAKLKVDYDALLDNEKLWKYAGDENPYIRKAVYNFLKVTLTKWPEMIEPRLSLVRKYFLNKAFAEANPVTHPELWDSLLVLTNEFPQVWLSTEKKQLFPKLLNALRNGLNGSVAIAYPSMLALFANLPNEVIKDYQVYVDLFTSFWAGGANEHIDQSNAAVFVNAFAECVVYMAATVSKRIDSDEVTNKVRTHLIEEDFGKVIKCYFATATADRFAQKLDPSSACVVISINLISLSSVQSLKDQFSRLWSAIESIAMSSVDINENSDTGLMLSQRTSYLLSSIHAACAQEDTKSDVILPLVEGLASTLVAQSVQNSLDTSLNLLTSFKHTLLKNESQTEVMFKKVQELASGLKNQQLENVPTLISFVVQFISNCDDKNTAESIWRTIIDGITFTEDTKEDDSIQLATLSSICEMASLDAAEQILHKGPLDAPILSLVQNKLCRASTSLDAAQGKQIQTIVINAVVAREGVLTPDSWQSVMTQLANLVFDGIQKITSGKPLTELESSGAYSSLMTAMTIVAAILANRECVSRIVQDKATARIVDSVFEATFITADADDDKVKQLLHEQAAVAWKHLLETTQSDNDLQQAIASRLCEHIRSALKDINNISSPADFVKRSNMILSGLCPAQSALRETIIDWLLLPVSDWHALSQGFLHQLPMDVIVFAITEPLVGAVHATPLEEDEMTRVEYDIYGLSSYGRCILYAHYLTRHLGLQLFVSDDGKAKRIEVLLELLTASQVCHKYLHSRLPLGIWERSKYETANEIAFRESHDISQNILRELVKTISSNSTTITPSLEWILSPSNSDDLSGQDSGAISSLIHAAVARAAQDQDNLFYAEVVDTICKTIFKGKSEGICDAWIDIVIKSDSSAVYYPLVIVDVIKMLSTASSPEVERFQNRLASQISSITPGQIFDDDNTSAWKSLVLLNQCISSKTPLTMPPQRLIFLLQSIRKWFDSDLASESSLYRTARVRAQYLKLLAHMASALLEVPGSHWDYMLSIIQEWLIISSVSSPVDAVLVFEALTLFSTLKDLSEENEDLLAAFADYNTPIQETIFDILIDEQSIEPSTPRLALHELLAQLLEDVPDKLVKQKSVEDELLSIVNAPSEFFQKATYKLLRTSIVEKAQDLAASLEFSHSEDNPSLVKFNPKLLEQILNPPDLTGWIEGQVTDQALHDIFGYMLSWMLLYDHFEDITFKLKSNYVHQLNENAATDNLLDFTFKLLGVGFDQSIEPFDLSKWEVDTFDILGFDLSFDFSLQLLAAHVYFRALQKTPSLVRQWWVEIRSRQLSLAVESYTSKYFSALIINREIESVIQADAKSILAEDENFTVKAMKAANEISAIYRVDDQNMEMAIRLPAMFPLRKVEVNGIQKVGVKEDRWRAWLLAVSAIIASQNGNLVDALTMFKRNVTMHFEGIEDCTICYSIVSVTDRSLPSKQCRTCKNKYHASCLYKLQFFQLSIM
ncbi:hypothetical protein Unana1_06482 [Umbelopsis nana]